MTIATKFRREADQVFGNRKHRYRYPQALKAMAVRHAAQVIGNGRRLSEAAEDLGVDVNSLRTWRRESKHAAAQRVPRVQRMRIVKDRTAPRFVVHAPQDLRIECADVDSVAELLRALR